mgnify:CR=1 FL=1
MTMREAMPRLAWLGMPIAPGARTRLLLWCKNGCGEVEVLGVLDPHEEHLPLLFPLSANDNPA